MRDCEVSEVILVQWLKWFQSDTNVLGEINTSIHQVVQDLQKEGVQVLLIQNESNSEVEYNPRLDYSQGYHLEMDITESDLSFKRFNQLLERWGGITNVA